MMEWNEPAITFVITISALDLVLFSEEEDFVGSPCIAAAAVSMTRRAKSVASPLSFHSRRICHGLLSVSTLVPKCV